MGNKVVLNNGRIEWLDISKGLLIMTIVLMHIDFSYANTNGLINYLSNFTSLYKVSVFFCISGFTLKNEKLDDTFNFIKNKFKKLYLKFVVIGLIAVLSHNLLIQIGFYKLGYNYSGKIMTQYSIADIIKQCLLTFLCANREVIIGPMWFTNVLFLALIIIALLNWVLGLIIKDEDKKRIYRLIICFMLMILSSFSTNILNLTIPRCNNTLTAVFLIDFCQYLVQNCNIKFNNIYCFIISTVTIFNLPFYGYFSMNTNTYQNPAFLIVTVVSGMYFIFYISQFLSRLKLFNVVVKYIGKNSFYIMAFHFLGFKIGSLILNYFYEIDMATTIPIATNAFLILYYFFIGIVIPCLLGSILTFINEMIKNKETSYEKSI